MSAAIVIIPARFHSTRLPEKMVRPVAGIPLIIRTARQALTSKFPVLVAYDDERIGKLLRAENLESIATKSTHQNGSERLAEVVHLKNFNDDTIVINVQGDEPLLPPELITIVAETLQNNPQAAVATLATPTTDAQNPNIVKVVLNQQNEALMFSRAAIPFNRDGGKIQYLRHIGIYAYRAQVLREYPSLNATPLEIAEKLEQLRFLEHSKKIAVTIIDNAPPHGVDTLEDLIVIERLLEEKET